MRTKKPKKPKYLKPVITYKILWKDRNLESLPHKGWAQIAQIILWHDPSAKITGVAPRDRALNFWNERAIEVGNVSFDTLIAWAGRAPGEDRYDEESKP
jgi:hypothetical protein